ncbi:MAG: hypothetical protein JNN08_22545 [Bryobacterales bacterium]|nr:hypothetical protein [Bryobacterales bacterium]
MPESPKPLSDADKAVLAQLDKQLKSLKEKASKLKQTLNAADASVAETDAARKQLK